MKVRATVEIGSGPCTIHVGTVLNVIKIFASFADPYHIVVVDCPCGESTTLLTRWEFQEVTDEG
jgi:hypothetical protein